MYMYLRWNLNAIKMKSRCNLDENYQHIKSQINRSRARSSDQKLCQQIKSQINRIKVSFTDQMLYQHIKILNRLNTASKDQKVKSTDQKFHQQIKSQINRLNVKSKVQNIDQQIKSWINRLRVIQMRFSSNLDAILMQYRCNLKSTGFNLDPIQMQLR